MSIQPPQGILTIPNATLRVGRLQVDEVKGFDTVLNTFDKNTILEEDSEEYDDDKKWGLKMPNIFVATFEIKGAGSSFNFRNTSTGTATTGYTLTFSETTLTLKYSETDPDPDPVPVLATATIPNLDFTYGKVYLTYEKQYFTVTVDGTRVLSYKDTVTRNPPDGEYINFFAGGDGEFKNLKVVAGHLISDGTSNVSLFGGLAVTSNLEVGSSNLFVDTVNSRVGMGTTTPEATLHVSGNAYVSSNLEVGSSNLFVDTVNSRVGVGTREPKESLDVVGNMHLTRVSNVSQIKVDSNVVTEYTGPHDRPLRKYPEVAMTSASQGGYVVDKSEESSSGDAYAAYRAFDGIIPDGTTTIGWRTDSGYNQDTGLADGGVTRFTGDSGEWVELQLPNSIKLSSIVLKVGNQGNNLANSQRRFPKVFVIYGYNGTSWDRIQEYTTSAIQSLTDVQTFHISNPTAYHNKFVLVVKQTYSVTGATSGVTNIGELEYYGYEEGSGSLDTTLKSVYNVPATTGTQLEVYYDGQDYTGGSTITDKVGNADATISSGSDITFDSTYKAWVFGGSTSRTQTIKTGTLPTSLTGGANAKPEISAALWFNPTVWGDDVLFTIANPAFDQTDNQFLEVRINGNQDWRIQVWDGQHAGHYSVPGFAESAYDMPANNWYHLAVSISGKTSPRTERKVYLNGIECTFKSQDATPSGVLNLPANSQLQLGKRPTNGSGADATDVGGKHFFGSIANFRLYSKVLNADQIKELYDYQKDYFLGSKSQVTLYKGHLGVGVTEPSGQLELAGDERIQEYPPRGMTDFDTYIEGHGVFKASATSHGGSIGTSKYHAWKAFNKDRTDANNGDNSWLNGPDISGGDYNTSTGVYEGTEKHHGGAPIGAALQLSMPYEIYLKGYSLAPWNYATGTDFQYADSPSDFIIYGSKDNVNWVQIDSRTGQGMSSQTDIKRFSLDTRDSYSHFAIVVTKNNTAAYPSTSASFVAIEEWRLFGTPGPTTLDKGSLSLTRSLDVPRISRYDVDTETPRPEKLVLDFDTTVNSSPTDISGKGNHGAFYNMASKYLESEKAFVFDGTNDHISTNEIVPSMAGAQPHTMSVWFKPSALGGLQFITCLGEKDGGGAERQFSAIRLDGSTLQFWTYSNDLGKNGVITAGVWYHAVAVYVGGATSQSTMLMYLNGEKITNWDQDSTDGQALEFVSPSFALGEDIGRSSFYFPGQISNPKLYNVALEPSEVKKLYNLGRTGRSMVISDTAVGIGKAPEAQLDVRGTARFDTISDFLKIDHPGNQLSLSRSDTDANEFRWYTWGNGCNWFTPYTGMSIYIGRDGQTIDEFDFYSVTTVKQGGTTLHSSDDRLKRDETFITNATNSILKLKPQTYIKKHRLPENENDTDIPEQFEAGLIAQDVWYDAPELRFLVHPSKDANPSETKPISPDPNDPTQDPDYSSWGTRQAYVNYEGFLPYLIKSNQEIYTELQAEKAKNEALETQVSDLLVRVTALENA
jgi:hypothetical protein